MGADGLFFPSLHIRHLFCGVLMVGIGKNMREKTQMLCKDCRKTTTFLKGQALKNTVVGSGPPRDGQTLHFGGPGELVAAWKCAECGYSVRACDNL